MPRLVKKDIQRASKDLNAVLTSNEVLASLNEAASDKQNLEMAKKDPRGFLRKRGVTLPRNIQFEFVEHPDRSSAARAVIRVTVCVRGCTKIGGVTVCGEICVSATFQV